MNNSFSKYVSDFFIKYLPNQKGFSKNTIISYKYTFIILLDYFDNILSMNINKLKIEDFNKENIIKFLDYLEKEKNNSVSTRNQRLSSIHSFCKYIRLASVEYINQMNEILNIEMKKSTKKDLEYLTKEEIKKIIDSFDLKSKKEYRDYTITSLLYDSGIRVTELLNIKIYNINFDNNTLTIKGKGNKIRTIPISSNVINIVMVYIDLYKINIKSNELLFFNSRKEKLTKEGIKYIIKKYCKRCNINKNVTPHTFRHSKAMHLLENNVNLIYIRDFLGHESITTTEIYAKANTDIKRKACENLSNELLNNDFYDNETKNELLTWLKESL